MEVNRIGFVKGSRRAGTDTGLKELDGLKICTVVRTPLPAKSHPYKCDRHSTTTHARPIRNRHCGRNVGMTYEASTYEERNVYVLHFPHLLDAVMDFITEALLL